MNLILSIDGQTLTFGVPVPIGTGEANVAINVGGEAEVFRDKTGVALNLRTLEGVNGISTTVVGDTIKIDGGALQELKSESLTYTDAVNAVLGPLAVTPSVPGELNLWVLQGLLQKPIQDFTVREVVGGSAPGFYLCVSTGSTAPGGGSFLGGSNPGTGIAVDLAVSDSTRAIYAV